MSNIYLNEFDRFVKHDLKPLAYLRYGDDWLCFVDSKNQVESIRQQATTFLDKELSLTVNPKIDLIKPAYRGVDYLGVEIWPTGRRLQPNVRLRVQDRLNSRNAASYRSVVAAHEKSGQLKIFNWHLYDLL